MKLINQLLIYVNIASNVLDNRTVSVVGDTAAALLYLRKHAVTQFVEALCYKPEGHGFDSRWCH